MLGQVLNRERENIMLNILQELLRAIWRILLVIPMPWRAAIITLAAIIIGYQFFYRFSILLLLPEFWITNRLRLWKLKPLPGTYIYDDMIELSIKIYRVLRSILIVVAIVGLIAWYSQEYVEDMVLARYITQMIDWWYSLERKVLSGG